MLFLREIYFHSALLNIMKMFMFNSSLDIMKKYLFVRTLMHAACPSEAM